jgi:dnaJ domain protein
MGSFLFWVFVFVLIYYLSSNYRKNPQSFGDQNREFSFIEAKYLVGLLAKVAKSDGRVNELEARLIGEILDDIGFKLGSRLKRDELRQIYNIEKENLANTYELARQYRISFAFSKDIAIARIAFLLNLAFIDGDFAVSERKTIETISDAFGLSRAELEVIILKFQNFYNSYKNTSNVSQKDPYEILQLPKNASFDEVKKKYRELVKKYHPDILMGRGESEEIIEKSTRKLQEINEAYETIKQNLS